MTAPDRSIRCWKITGIIATLVIILSLPLYLIKEKRFSTPEDSVAAKPPVAFIGSEKCKECHQAEYDRWKGSHHDLAMATASEKTVRGDFENARFSHFGKETRFFRKDGKFFVNTQGPDGKTADFEITHTFGWYPLQQYLIPFPRGRLQCLPVAWDVKQNKWYHLYPEEPPDPQDWLYWTNSAQNWNGMCAECHSTDLKKNYNPDTDTYQTTWAAINVGCEACHGPGGDHANWAALPAMARLPAENYKLTVRTSGMNARRQNELCAPCHSRRMSLGDNTHQHKDFMDYAAPQLLREGFYFPDGQILEEVYVYGSFMQSKMYDRDVRCSDCHDVHSIKRIRQGNELCLQCHRADLYDTKLHHFHKKKDAWGEPLKSSQGEILAAAGSGAECERCHIPGRLYMGIDYRPDHSFRTPRPDLSITLGVPNACNQCHTDKTNQWSSEYIAKWYGARYKPHYGTILDAGRKHEPEAKDNLIRLAGDRLYPALVRASALDLLTDYAGPEIPSVFENALTDEEPLMRQTALRYSQAFDLEKRIRLFTPLLYDPVKAVRIEAADSLAGVPSKLFNTQQQKKFRTVLEEYKQAMLYTADFAPSRHNLGNLYAARGLTENAVKEYKQAVRIDREFYPAKVNLAMLYNKMGKNDAAESLLRDVITAHPDFYEIRYSLGLLLAEEKKFREAAESMGKAAQGLPQRARIHYNLGLIQAYLQRYDKAEASLLKALAIQPNNRDILYAVIDFYIKRGKPATAEKYVQVLMEKYPDWPLTQKLAAFIKRQK